MTEKNLLPLFGKICVGCTIGIAPYALLCGLTPELALWDPRDWVLSGLGIALMCVSGMMALEALFLPIALEAWREFDRAVLLPRMRVKRSGKKWRR